MFHHQEMFTDLFVTRWNDDSSDSVWNADPFDQVVETESDTHVASSLGSSSLEVEDYFPVDEYDAVDDFLFRWPVERYIITFMICWLTFG